MKTLVIAALLAVTGISFVKQEPVGKDLAGDVQLLAGEVERACKELLEGFNDHAREFLDR